MTDEQILAAIQARVENGRINCGDALEIAAELQIRPVDVGRVCDLHSIRIANCQLGCFGSPSERRGR